MQNSVLLLSSHELENHETDHFLTDASGREEENFFFRYGDNAGIRKSCTITYQNQHYVIGGEFGRDETKKEKVTSIFRIIFYI